MTKKKIILKKIDLKKNILKKYQNWMNDLEVHKFTEQKYRKHSISEQGNLLEKNKSNSNFYRIFIKENYNHI